VLDDVLRAGHLDDAAAVDPATLAVRDLAREVREDERLVPVLLPVSGGLLCALRK
jgi:predicted O-methyltransferase YrrM